jgi:chitinase
MAGRFRHAAAAWLGALLLVSGAAHASAPGPDHVVLAYSAYWQDARYPPEAYNFRAFTYIARAFLKPQADGRIPVEEGYFNPALTRLAKASGVKLLISLGGWSAGSKNWLSIAAHPEYERRFFSELDELVRASAYDGIDIDWEPGPTTEEERKAFTAFMGDLRLRFPSLILTTAVTVQEESAAHLDWKEIESRVDYMSLMTFDFCGSLSRFACHNADLRTVDETVRRLESRYGLDPSKALLGLAIFGKLFYVRDWNEELPAAGARMAYLDYSDALTLADGGGYVESWDEGAQASYLRKKPSGAGVVTYESPRSLALKCRYAAKNGFAGVLVWRLGYDVVGDRTPLLDKLAEAFGSSGERVPPESLARMDRAFAGAAQGAFEQLSQLSRQLLEKGEKEEAAASAPQPLPELALPDGRRRIAGHLRMLQAYLTDASQKIQRAKQVLGLPFE